MASVKVAEVKLCEFGEHREPTTPSQGRAYMKNCLDCGIKFLVTGRNHKRCVNCAKQKQKEAVKQWSVLHGKLNGKGSGSFTGFEDKNHMYTDGRCVFRRWAKEKLKQLEYCCERCGNKIDASVRGTWAGHHKDHNSKNNIKENLEVLCKKCHQIEHECWRAFQGVTTIPEGSTLEIVEAHSPSLEGDDIVCSV